MIQDLPEMKRMIRSIAREVAQEVTKELPSEKQKPFMTKQDAYREVGSRDLVDKAIKNGTLRVRVKEGRPGILRREFEAWKDRFQGDTNAKSKSSRSFHNSPCGGANGRSKELPQ